MSADDARRRFDDATRTHLLAPLPGGVEVVPCSADDWRRLTDPWWALEPRPRIDLAPLHSDAERAQIADLDAVLGAPQVSRSARTVAASRTPVATTCRTRSCCRRGAAAACTARCSRTSRRRCARADSSRCRAGIAPTTTPC